MQPKQKFKKAKVTDC